MADIILTPCNVARSRHWFRQVTVASGMWLSNRHTEFAQTSTILEFYIWFPYPHITAVDMSFCTSLQNFIQIRPPSAEKMTSCRFSRWWRMSAILDFRGLIMGSLKIPSTTSYRSSIDTIALNCLVFEKIAFFCILATDRQTNRRKNRWTAPMH